MKLQKVIEIFSHQIKSSFGDSGMLSNGSKAILIHLSHLLWKQSVFFLQLTHWYIRVKFVFLVMSKNDDENCILKDQSFLIMIMRFQLRVFIENAGKCTLIILINFSFTFENGLQDIERKKCNVFKYSQQK